MARWVRSLRWWVFVAGLAGTGAILWNLSGSSWGRREEHVVLGVLYRSVGRHDAARLSLQPLEGSPGRQPLEVPAEIHDAVRQNDLLRIRVRAFPLAASELVQYSLVRGGTPVEEWTEGWPFFGATLGAASLLGAGILLGLFFWISAFLRLENPSE